MTSIKLFSHLRSDFSQSYHKFYTSVYTHGRAYTRESKEVPGSEEFVNPDKWADRLFKLNNAKCLETPKEVPLLFMVCRIKPMKGLMHFQKAILEKYNLGMKTKNHNWVILKNVPSVNCDLNQIKHVIKINPIHFQNGIPKNENDLNRCKLLPNGNFYLRDSAVESDISDQLAIADQSPDQSLRNYKNDYGYLNRKYLRLYHNEKWKTHSLFNEFFASHYKYKLNQDGQEYRYSKLWRLDNAMLQSIQSKRNADGTFKQPNCNRFEADWNTYPWSKF